MNKKNFYFKIIYNNKNLIFYFILRFKEIEKSKFYLIKFIL